MKRNVLLQLFFLTVLFIPNIVLSGEWSSMNSGTTNDLISVWGISGTDVFAVGGHGTILHYNGTSWSTMDSGTSETLIRIWGSSGTDVFAVGSNGTILHYNGTSWSPMNSGSSDELWGVWGSSGTDVFAVGGNGTILHYNGSMWSSMTSGTTVDLYGVGGSSGGNVFAVGSNNTIIQYNGTNWSSPVIAQYSNTILYDIWVSSETDIYVVGGNGGDYYAQSIIYHYDGNSWSGGALYNTYDYDYLSGVWGSSGVDVYAVGAVYEYPWQGAILHYDGNEWSYIYTLSGVSQFWDVWGSSRMDVFFVGDEGTILHYDNRPTYSISGVVTGDVQTDVTITLSGSSSGVTMTDSYGNYVFTGLHDGIYTVTPSKSGYTFSPSSRTVTIDGTSVQGQNFVSFVVNTYSISGVITGDVQDGVTMTLSGSGSATISTDSSGNYSFKGLNNGTYTVTPSKAGYFFTPSSRTITIDNANVAGADFIATTAVSCTSWSDVIAKYNSYVSGQAVWNDVITCYTEYTSTE